MYFDEEPKDSLRDRRGIMSEKRRGRRARTSKPGILADSSPESVVRQLRRSVLSRIRKGEEVIPAIDGREETKDDVIRVILSGANLYLVSEEGTGKTRMARAISNLLPPIPVIKGSPYNDDPRWPSHRLSPWCRTSVDPVREFGITWLPGEKRFSRIQGNEYTNEAKLLGLKDIQAIAQGRSPSDPSVFTGTGVFRANRGVLFIDELPAIRTRVQVLLHPILEEKKAVLEEYKWEWPLDLFVVATGNPEGFSHVNDVPRPLMDRLETVYMDLPEETIEKEIVLKERFRELSGGMDIEPGATRENALAIDSAEDTAERVLTPWWILEVIGKAVRLARGCPRFDKKPTIRATIRAFDHTRSTAEMNLRRVPTLADTGYGLKLALRSRVSLQPDYVDFENPRENFRLVDQIVEDTLALATEGLAEELSKTTDLDRIVSNLKEEIDRLGREGYPSEAPGLTAYPVLSTLVEQLKRMAPKKTNLNLLSEGEKVLFTSPQSFTGEITDEYDRSAVEMAINLAVCRGVIKAGQLKTHFFVPERFGASD
jgi:Mg-chelatase subunit ChlI